MNTFAGLLAELVRSKVEFLLVGGLAVELAGFSRTTMDVDILVEDSAPNLTLLLEVLSRFGEGSARELSTQDFTPDEGCIRVIEDFPLDIFTRMGGHTYHNLLPLSCLHMLGDQSLRYLGPKGLLLLKQSSNRPKDKVDVIELQKLIDSNQNTKPRPETL